MTCPAADIVLRIPNTFSTTDSGALNLVQGTGGVINPAGAEEDYSTLIRDAYLSLEGVWSHVQVMDTSSIFGTQATARNPMLGDQVHPSPRSSAMGTGPTWVPLNGGDVAIADLLAATIGQKSTATPGDLMLAQRFRQEFLVVAGAGAGGVDLAAVYPLGPTAAQQPITQADSLYVPGLGQFAMTSASISRTFATNSIRITNLPGSPDLTAYSGRVAVVTGAHPGPTTGDRQIVSVDLPSIAAGAIVTATVAVTIARTGDRGDATSITVSPAAASTTSGLILQNAYPTANDVVTLVIYNPTAGAMDLAAANWAFWVLR
ncbi:hypothetical protein Kisp01_27650 [Kineosporia sp. NBRC 101677]|uniref:hypothetical protein n=1 Tax=Kineosporia sp. NBRC 101677 TaxID=3032197 RepID=UPI0024A47253|nr:hypothetical protein [Kineosporia sp. NBRC 101677]GLY15750.1 hypothetical protein Kisp01_27650 [Kineosporia sp. NBRC 101677]